LASWRDLRRLALALPGTSEEGTDDKNLSWKVKGKGFAWQRPLRRADLEALGKKAPTGPILGVRTADLEMKEVLLASDPAVYFTTPHFDGYPALLVRLTKISVKELKSLLVEAWLARAPDRVAKEFLHEKTPPRKSRKAGAARAKR